MSRLTRRARRDPSHPAPAAPAATEIPAAAAALCAEGARHQEGGRPDDAVRCFAGAVHRAPHAVELRLILALALAGAGRSAEGRAVLRAALERAPLDFADAVRVGEALRRLGDPDGAADCYRQALAQRPGAASLLANLGGVLQQAGRLAEAREVLVRAVEAQRGADAAALVNLGVVEHALGDYQAAARRLDEALVRHPGHPRALRNRALVHLTLGDHARGWAEHEHRFDVIGDGTARPAYADAARAWDGAPLAGERVLLWPEQGLGDQLQFARFAALVRQRGGEPVLRCAGPLARLLTSCRGVAEVSAEGDAVPAFARHAPLMSLPHLLGVGGEVGGGAGPYLAPVGAPPSALADVLAVRDEGALRAGLVWAGAPGHANDRNRSIPLATLAPLLETGGVRWHSLQHGPAAAALREVPGAAAVRDLAPHCADFNDTAHAVAALDLVVAVDTSVAHLAGAMGKPVWLLLPHVPDWRWLLGRADTPWYPTMRLFRQPAAGDWDAVVREVRSALPAARGG